MGERGGDEVLSCQYFGIYKMRQVQCWLNERTHTIITFVTQQQPG